MGAVGFHGQRLQLPPDVDADVTALVERCWSNNQRERPSFAELLDLLKLLPGLTPSVITAAAVAERNRGAALEPAVRHDES